MLDLLDLGHSPLKSILQLVIDINQILHNADLVAVAAEQTHDLLIVHAAEDGPLADFESVGMQNGDDGT